MTADSLIVRVEHDKLALDPRTVVVMDEAGMADTRRLAQLIEITRASDSKLVLAGDSAQLSPIGAGGLFKELTDSVPTAQLTEVHRAHHEWERDAWTNLRNGDAERALEEYHARGRLHIEETRTEAGERMVSDWTATRAAHPGERVVMITDASNHELDRLNKQAQDERAKAGELGPETVTLPDRPYGLRSGDEIIFSSQHRVPGQDRVENGTRGHVVAANERDSHVLIRTEEPKPRDINVSTREFDGLRLAYAQHVYKAQGLTADRSLVLTGGWQTDRETAYVALTRAREQTDIYTSRDDLGHAGIDTDADQAASRSVPPRATPRKRASPENKPSPPANQADSHANYAKRWAETSYSNANAETRPSRTTSQTVSPTGYAKRWAETSHSNANATAAKQPSRTARQPASPTGYAKRWVETPRVTENTRTRRPQAALPSSCAASSRSSANTTATKAKASSSNQAQSRASGPVAPLRRAVNPASRGCPRYAR